MLVHLCPNVLKLHYCALLRTSRLARKSAVSLVIIPKWGVINAPTRSMLGELCQMTTKGLRTVEGEMAKNTGDRLTRYWRRPHKKIEKLLNVYTVPVTRNFLDFPTLTVSVLQW